MEDLTTSLKESLEKEIVEFETVKATGTPQNEKEVKSNLARNMYRKLDSFGMSFIGNRRGNLRFCDKMC